jgi:ornithine carbamoyltransferase
VYVGDGNNVAHSLLYVAGVLGMRLAVCTPPGYRPNAGVLQEARALAASSGAEIELLEDPHAAVKNARFLYTDVWTSMGQEKETQARMNAFRPYQVNSRTVAMAKKDAVVMHCLPAHRGEEISHEVLESEQCVAFDQAENRLHVQKAIMVWLLNGPAGRKAPESKSSSKRKSPARNR